MTEPTTRRRNAALLAGGALLLVLAVVLLILLHRPAREATTVSEAGTAPARPAAARQPHGSTPSRTPPPLPHSSVARAGGDTPPTPASGSGSGPPPPSVVHASAPPAIPSEIQNERDPKRKAELLKMHKLATARVRVSMLRHRANLLRIAIDKGKRDGSWSAEKLREAETSLRQLSTGIAAAEQDLDQVRTEVGGDIDRDK